MIRHSKGSKIVVTRKVDCLAKPITEVLSSSSWRDRRCFLIGGSPSLENFDFNLIEDELTIGVNKSFTKFPTTINYAMDMGFYDKITFAEPTNSRRMKLHQQWLDYKGIKVFLRRPKFKLDPSVYVVDDIKEKILSFDLGKGIYGGNNSGFSALMLAIALGATKIGLLGYSMKIDPKARRTHWHSGYEGQRFDSMQSKLDRFKICFEEIAPLIDSTRIKVINLDSNSKLECFEKDSLENFLKKYSK